MKKILLSKKMVLSIPSTFETQSETPNPQTVASSVRARLYSFRLREKNSLNIINIYMIRAHPDCRKKKK